MNSEVWVVGTLLTSIILIVFTIVKGKVHPFLALLLASFYVGTMMGMNPVKMVNAMEEGIGGTLGFLAAVIGLGTILGKMMEVSGAAERIGLALQKCRWLSPQVIMVLVGLVCGITLFVEVGVVLLIPLAFSIARKTRTSLLTLAIPLCTALMAVHCIVPPHPAALYVTNQLGADIGSVIVYGLAVGLFASLVGGPLFLKLLGKRVPFKEVPAAFANIEARDEASLPTLSASLFTVLLPILLMLAKTVAELNMDHASSLYTVLEFIGNPITAMFIAAFTAYYVLGIRQHMKEDGRAAKPDRAVLLLHRQYPADHRGRWRLQRRAQGERTGRRPGDHPLPAGHAPYPAGLAGGHSAARSRRLGHGRHDGGHRHRLPHHGALPEHQPRDHDAGHRLRRHRLHHGDRLPVLAGQAVLRRHPE